MADPKTGIRSTMQPGWTFPIPLVDQFLAVCKRRMVKPSQLATQILREWLEKNE